MPRAALSASDQMGPRAIGGAASFRRVISQFLFRRQAERSGAGSNDDLDSLSRSIPGGSYCLVLRPDSAAARPSLTARPTVLEGTPELEPGSKLVRFDIVL